MSTATCKIGGHLLKMMGLYNSHLFTGCWYCLQGAGIFYKKCSYNWGESQIVTIKSKDIESDPSESSVEGNPEPDTED